MPSVRDLPPWMPRIGDLVSIWCEESEALVNRVVKRVAPSNEYPEVFHLYFDNPIDGGSRNRAPISTRSNQLCPNEGAFFDVRVKVSPTRPGIAPYQVIDYCTCFEHAKTDADKEDALKRLGLD